MAINTDNVKSPALLSAIAIGVGCIIGSGWLFASYNAAKSVGSMSFLSWIIGAVLALILALLLAETATMFKERAFFARILTLSHKNTDYGFVVAISNLMGLILVIPSEASATIQYLSGVYPSLMVGDDLSLTGEFFVVLIIIVYGLINFWGIRILSKVNNFITFFKMIIPLLTGFIIIIYAGWNGQFHMSNFALSGFHQSMGSMIGGAITTVVTGGIFYSFYGFGMIAIFGAELKNPKRNIPLALISCVLICLVVYIILQFAFIGAMPTKYLSHGWQNLQIFSSPLAQLLGLIGVNVFMIWVLYADSAISPSGTGALYMGSSSRMITGMAQDKQLPNFFNCIIEKYNLSRRSLAMVFIIGIVMVFFSKNWQNIMIMVTVFQLISCIAIPVALSRLRKYAPDQERPFKVPFALTLSYIIFLVVSYLMIQASMKAVVLAFIVHLILFVIYSFSYYQGNFKKILKAIYSSWSIFLYLAISIPFSHLIDIKDMNHLYSIVAFLVAYTVLYISMVNQKNYQLNSCQNDNQFSMLKESNPA
ncbi:APC family permease [Thiotrichales bacterium 19X7-9]|nr:APC family permease [Thiotrichales bacterium 19X7-9]